MGKTNSKEDNRTHTSIKVDNELWRQIKIQSAKEDTTIIELVEKALRQYVEGVDKHE